ncbi:MAG: hypothetical protein ABWX81_11595 [Pseudolabrys sp.]
MASYRALWKSSNVVRQILSRAPYPAQIAATTVIAVMTYWPLASYRRHSFYVMRTDAFDRFCTRLEQRFTRVQITDMLRAADFDDIRFSEQEPFWVAVAIKRQS